MTTRIERVGARVLFVDDTAPEIALLLVRGHDPHVVARTFWFTPGGGIEEGESARQAAVRELVEETGFVVTVDELVGPVWRRVALFDFASQPYVQREEFFVARRSDAEVRGRTAAEWTAAEVEAIDEVAWLTESELSAVEIEVFPLRLRRPWSEFLDWDGATIELGEESE